VISGKTVIVSSATQAPLVRYFGRGAVAPIAHDIAGAAALRKPIMWNITFIPLYGIVVALVIMAQRRGGSRRRLWFYAAAVLVGLIQPAILRLFGIVADPGPTITFLVCFSAIRFWQKRLRRVQHTSRSGLPNLLAMSADSLAVGSDVVVAVIARYEEILATLPNDLHGECANQIARRLSVGSGAGQIYHGDGGHFAWCEEARPIDVQLNHLQGLRALFSAPLQIGTHTFDTNIHFGLDRNEGLDALTRINSALASANDALTNGRPVEVFEAERLADAPGNCLCMPASTKACAMETSGWHSSRSGTIAPVAFPVLRRLSAGIIPRAGSSRPTPLSCKPSVPGDRCADLLGARGGNHGCAGGECIGCAFPDEHQPLRADGRQAGPC
jgi:hypothetical protein